jgi:hypothetical protein
MTLARRFEAWVADEVGSATVPALRQHLKDRDYRVFSYVEYDGYRRADVYHPRRGFFHACGKDDADALLGVLRQIWLVESLAEEAGGARVE